MLDFRIIIAAIIVCVSLIMTGARLLSTSDAFNITGTRPSITTLTDPSRAELPAPIIGAKAPARFDLPSPAIAAKLRPPVEMPPLTPAVAARPTAPAEARRPAAALEAKAVEPDPIEPAEKTARLPRPTTPAAPSPTIRSTRAAQPAPEITGSIPAHPEAEPNVEPDWKQKLPPRRNIVATPAPQPPRSHDVAPPRPADEVDAFKNSVAK